MPTERFQFTGEGGHQLAAALDLPDGETRGLRAVRALLHLRQGRAGGQAHRGRRWPPRASRCCASTSPGSAPARAISPTRRSPPTSPIWCAPPIICAQTRKAPAILIGHSLGGAAILAAAGQIPEARAVVTIAAPSDPAHVTGLFKDQHRGHPHAGRGRGLARGPAVPHQARIPRRRRRAGADDARRRTCTRRCWSCIRRPTTPSASTTRRSIFVAAKHPKSFVSLAGADHLLSRQARRRLCRRRDRRLGRALSRPGCAGAGRRSRRSAAQGRGARDPRQQIPADRHRRAASAARRRAGRGRRRGQPAPGPTTSCSPGSAPAPR